MGDESIKASAREVPTTACDTACLHVEALTDHNHHALYNEVINDVLELLIDVPRLGEGKSKMRIRSRILSCKQELANFVFREEADYWTLSHRIMHDRAEENRTINGSWLLVKIESLFRILFGQGLLMEKPLHINAGQLPVIAWAIKNGYTPATEEDAVRYDTVTQNPEDFEFDISIATDNGITRGDYMIEKSRLTPELKDALQSPVSEAYANDIIYNIFFRISLVKNLNDRPDQIIQGSSDHT